MKKQQTARIKSIRIDVLDPNIGRIQRSIGSDSPRQRDNYLAMIRALQREGRLDVLRSLKDGVLTFARVYEAHAKGELDKLPSAETLLPLRSTWQDWMDDLRTAPEDERVSEQHLIGHRHALTRIAREVPADASVADLPQALEALRKTYRWKARTFNKTHASVRAFLRDTLRRQHALYHEVAAIPVLPWTRKRDPKPQTVRTLLALQETLAPELYAIVWALATTGMNPKEYWFDGWTVAPAALHIAGRKRGGRDRDIPDLGRCTAPEWSYEYASEQLRGDCDFMLKDLRNTFANWMEQAGVPRTRRRMYLGHGAADVTDLYEHAEISQFLREDGDRLRAWLVGQGAPALAGEAPDVVNVNVLKLEVAR